MSSHPNHGAGVMSCQTEKAASQPHECRTRRPGQLDDEGYLKPPRMSDIRRTYHITELLQQIPAMFVQHPTWLVLTRIQGVTGSKLPSCSISMEKVRSAVEALLVVCSRCLLDPPMHITRSNMRDVHDAVYG